MAGGRQGSGNLRLPHSDSAGRHHRRAQGDGPYADACRTEPGRTRRNPAEPRRWSQTRAEGGHRPQGGRQADLSVGAGDCCGARVHGVCGDPLRSRSVDPRSANAAAAHRLSSGCSVHPRGDLGRCVRDSSRWMGLRVHLSSTRRPTVHRTGHLVRDRHGPVVHSGVPVRGDNVHLRNRCGAGQHLVHLLALPLVCHLSDLDGGGNESGPLRSARSRG